VLVWFGEEVFSLIHVIDYGLGNIEAFLNLYKRLGYGVTRATNVDDLNGATKVILPGVGAFDYAMMLLNQSGMRAALDDLVLEKKVPVLGVCVGMQIMAHSSEEGLASGLGWISAKVRGLSKTEQSQCLPVPHMGWNECTPKIGHPLFLGFESDPRFYFLHSYYFDCDDHKDIAATTIYGFNFCSAISHNNIYGVQFHPEKSHDFGACLLKNFAEISNVET